MIKVQVSSRKSVFVKFDQDNAGVFCKFYGDDSEDFPLGEKYIRVPRSCPKNTINLLVVNATKDYFAR